VGKGRGGGLDANRLLCSMIGDRGMRTSDRSRLRFQRPSPLSCLHPPRRAGLGLRPRKPRRFGGGGCCSRPSQFSRYSRRLSPSQRCGQIALTRRNGAHSSVCGQRGGYGFTILKSHAPRTAHRIHVAPNGTQVQLLAIKAASRSDDRGQAQPAESCHSHHATTAR